MACKASEGKFDIREDEEQYERLQDSVDLLVAAGYFRARIKGLPAFDKIVGGMVWCISTCNYTVDVDLLYAENSTIGQKIALTEKIVEVLPQLQCPHSLEPHQIQGLDFIHIFPVIQWLVKKAIEARQEHGDQQQAFLHSLHSQKSKEVDLSCPLSGRIEDLSCEAGIPNRLFRRGPTVQISSLVEDLRYTLAEYAHGSTVVKSGEQISSNIENSTVTGMEPSVATRTRASGRALKQLVDSEAITDLASALSGGVAAPENVQIEDIEQQILQLTEEYNRLGTEVRETEEEITRKESELAVQEETLEHFLALDSKYSSEEKNEMRKILEEFSEVASTEAEFKAAANSEMERISQEIELMQERLSEADTSSGTHEEATLRKEELSCARERTAAASQAVSRLQRALDSIPSQVELAQYQKRFIELGHQTVSEHRRTRQAFTDHNTMLDVRNYLRKELELLNGIEDIVTKGREDYRDSLNEKLHTLLKGIEAALDKSVTQEKELECRREQLSQDIACLNEKQRFYNKNLSNVQKECLMIEELAEIFRVNGLEYKPKLRQPLEQNS